MGKTETESRCIVTCRSCGHVFAAKRRLDGTFRPIGVAECPCGDGEFHRMNP